MWRWWLVGMWLVTLLGCTSETSEAKAGVAKKKPVRKANVAITTASPGSLEVSQSYLGEVQPRLEATLAAGADGQIASVESREGAPVRRGDTLVVIDGSLIGAELKAAQATRERLGEERAQALREAERIERLGPKVTPQIEAERQRSRARALAAGIASQDAVIKRARAQRARHRVRAPFDGVITRRLRDPGDWVGPGTPVLEVVDPSRVEVFVRVPARLAEDVTVGHVVELRGRNHKAPGKVVGVVPALEPTTRTLTLRVAPDAPAPWMLPGAAVSCQLKVTRTSDGVRVPRDAIVRGAQGARVVLVTKESTARHVDVEVVEGSDTQVLLRAHEALTPETRIVIRGNERLRPGQPLNITEEAP